MSLKLLRKMFFVAVTGSACAAQTPTMGTSSVTANDSPGSVLTPAGRLPTTWTAAERGQPIAIRTLRTTEQASFHLVHAVGAEEPHYHDRTDLTVFVLSGEVDVHLGERTQRARVGDVIEIPKGTKHWVANAGAGPSLSYVVFSPPFDGKDRRFVGD